jgi:hypothetical protein
MAKAAGAAAVQATNAAASPAKMQVRRRMTLIALMTTS